MSKYGAKPTHVDNIRFASLAEAARYQELKLLQYAGEISGLVCHPKFLLSAGFTDRFGNVEKAVTYTADFQYTENGVTTVEDVKGFSTRDWKLKRHWFRRVYPYIHLKEVK